MKIKFLYSYFFTNKNYEQLIIFVALFTMFVWTRKHYEQRFGFGLNFFLIFWATLGIYKGHFWGNIAQKNAQKLWLLGLFLLWLALDWQTKIWCLVAAILQCFYDGCFVKIFKKNNHSENSLLFWRKNLWLKPLCIGLMWTLATLLFPILPIKNGLELTKISCFLVVERWSWVSALAIATDIFDQSNDSNLRLATFPTTFSSNIVFIFIFLGFFISVLGAFGYVTEGGYSMRQLQLKIFFVAISFYVLRHIAHNLPKWKHLRWFVDALMIVERLLFF